MIGTHPQQQLLPLKVISDHRMLQSKSQRISEMLTKRIITIIHTVHSEYPMLLLPITAHRIGYNPVNSTTPVSSVQETLLTATAVVAYVLRPETLEFHMGIFIKTKLTT